MKTQILRARFAVRKASPGKGYGLFATASLSSGDFVLEYRGRHVPTERADKLKTKYLFEVNSTWTIDGSSRGNTARYINHSCEPNCEATLTNGHVLIHAVRDIQKGEELTIDYGEEYFNEFIKPYGCKCARCTAQHAQKTTPIHATHLRPRLSSLAFWRR